MMGGQITRRFCEKFPLHGMWGLWVEWDSLEKFTYRVLFYGHFFWITESKIDWLINWFRDFLLESLLNTHPGPEDGNSALVWRVLLFHLLPFLLLPLLRGGSSGLRDQEPQHQGWDLRGNNNKNLNFALIIKITIFKNV